MSAEQNAGRWTGAVAAVVLVACGFVGSLGIALAGEPDNVGAPGGDGEDVTCTAYQPPTNASICNMMGEDGADGGTGMDYR